MHILCVKIPANMYPWGNGLQYSISSGKVGGEIKFPTHLEFLGGFTKAQFTQGDPLDCHWVREDYFLESNILNISTSGEMIPCLANCDTNPSREKSLEDKRGGIKTYINDMSGKKKGRRFIVSPLHSVLSIKTLEKIGYGESLSQEHQVRPSISRPGFSITTQKDSQNRPHGN